MTSDVSLEPVQRACLYICDTTCHALCACRYGNEATAPAAGLVLARLLSSLGQLLENVHAIYDMLEETVIHFTPTQAGTPCDSASSNSRLCVDHVCSCLSIYSHNAPG